MIKTIPIRIMLFKYIEIEFSVFASRKMILRQSKEKVN